MSVSEEGLFVYFYTYIDELEWNNVTRLFYRGEFFYFLNILINGLIEKEVLFCRKKLKEIFQLSKI